MRGRFQDQSQLFSYVSPERRVPANHPLRQIRQLVRDVLKELSRSLGELYASEGRPSVPPEQLLSALLLQVFYGIRSERQLTEQLDYNLLFRWFVGLSPDDQVWDATTFTKNRERLQSGDIFQKFMTRLLNHPQVEPLLSDEHFSVDGTLIEAWAKLAKVPSAMPMECQRRARRRAFVRRTAVTRRAAISTVRSARTRPTPAPLIRTAGSIARRPDARRSSAPWGTSAWTTGMVWRWRAR